MTSRKDVLLFLGAPGSGKGTLAQRCCAELGYGQVSTGNLCREHVARGTSIGKEIDLALKSGKLIDDSIITTMIVDWFAHSMPNTRVILDGYPRTVAQVEALHDFLVSSDVTKPTVVQLVVTPQQVIDRLSMRLICSKAECQAVYSLAGSTSGAICARCSAPLIRRPDDEPEEIRKRLKLYSVHEASLLERYRVLDYKIVSVDASGSMDDVFDIFRERLGACS